MRLTKSAFIALALFGCGLPLAAAQPQLVSLSPSSGSGLNQTFTLTASDSAGASGISGMSILINSSFSGTNACWVFYDHVHNQAYLASDDTSHWSPLGSGSPSGSQNTQCFVEFAGSSDSGNNASFSINVQFSTGWVGNKTIWGRANDLAGDDSGYQPMGTFTATTGGPTPDFTLSITPSSQSVSPGNSASYNYTVTSQNGMTGSMSCSFAYSGSSTQGVSAAQNNCSTSLPANGAVSGTILVTSSDNTPPGFVTITDMVTVAGIEHSFQIALNVNSPSVPGVSVSPSSGQGSTQTFTISITDQGGYQSVNTMHFLINSSFTGNNGCWFYFAQNPNGNGSGVLYLASDDTSQWSSTFISPDPESPAALQNSQCTLWGGPSTASGSGNTLTIQLTLQFSATFAGAKNVYVDATDQAGPDTGYQQKGTWTAQAATMTPDYRVDLTPGTQTVTGQATPTYSVGITAANGFGGTVDFTVAGLPPNSTLTPPSSIQPGNSTQFVVNTTGSTPPGSYTLTVTGTSGSLSHSAQVVLNVQGAAVPTVSVSPSSGSGAQQMFTFSFNGTDVNAQDVLFNTSVSGQNACWISDDGFRMWLASDDGTAWSATDSTHPTLQNSQCTVTLDGNTSTGFSATITFSSGFAGTKNIYMYASNTEGAQTGYQLQGTWTVP